MVIGTKNKSDCVLLTLAERKTRTYLARKITSKTAKVVIDELSNLQEDFGDKFTQVFKSITSDNGLEFADLHKLELQSNIKIYFTHPYASWEKGTNERHNGLLRRFIPKGTPINHYSIDEIAMVEE